MTITTEKRDLFTMPQGYYLAHCINAAFELGAGIAKSFDSVYNMRFKLLKHYSNYEYCGGDSLQIDNVFNLVTKQKRWHQPTYESVREALEMMKEQLDFAGATKLAMPKIAAGLDRLEMEETDADDVALIKTLMNESAGKFRKAWRVKNLKTQERFDKFVAENGIKDTRLLFHGSRSENFWSIIKTGLVLRPTNAVITGKMLGYGIYFAPKCQKSIGYTSLSGSYWAHGGNSVAYMALFEVAYGTPYDVYSFDSKYYSLDYDKLQQFCPGANCVHAHADRGMLRNDEIVVYKEDQLTIKYLIEIG